MGTYIDYLKLYRNAKAIDMDSGSILRITDHNINLIKRGEIKARIILRSYESLAMHEQKYVEQELGVIKGETGKQFYTPQAASYLIEKCVDIFGLLNVELGLAIKYDTIELST